MSPSSIQRTIQVARSLLDETGYGNPEAFIISWIAWEKVKFRTLQMGLVKHGFTLKTTDVAIRDSKLHQRDTFKSAFEQVFGRRPGNLPKLPKSQWALAESHRELRHKVVHGFGQDHPRVLRQATSDLLGVLDDLSWTQGIPVKVDGKDCLLGHILKRPAYETGVHKRQSVAASKRRLGLLA